MRQIKRVLELRHERRLSIRNIARSLGVPISTISDYLQQAREAGQSWPLSASPRPQPVRNGPCRPAGLRAGTWTRGPVDPAPLPAAASICQAARGRIGRKGGR